MDREFLRRLRIVRWIFIGVFLVFTVRLIDLQILHYDEYAAEAKAQHERRSVLPARRGRILVRKNRLTEEVTPVATNNTLKMLFVDPVILHYPEYDPNKEFSEQTKGNPNLAAEILAPILIHSHCEKVEGCEIITDSKLWTASERTAIEAYRDELTEIFQSLERTRVVLMTDLAVSRAAHIESLHLPGVTVQGGTLIADPTQITDRQNTALELSPLLNMEVETLERLLERRPKRYVEIVHKMVPEVSERIIELKNDSEYRDVLRGIQMVDEYWRYYPEKEFGSQIIGFVDSEGNGQYGVEGYFDQQLRGKEGVIYGATNTRGQRLLGKGSDIIRAQDGDDILLTIDRVIQGEIEKILQEDVRQFDADFGQIIVLEPDTGKILALAQAPSFDPNAFGEVFSRYEIPAEQEQIDREDELFNQRIPTVQDQGRLYRYFNTWGPQVFRNKVISDSYEPGSVLKAVTMAIALNAKEVTPQTTYDDNGPIEVEEYKIRNADETYAGETSMLSVLNRSLNTGIAFITRKMGAKMLYESFIQFGFGQYTDIELAGEEEGTLEHYQDWSESELITRGFGQGMTATALQVALSFSALANGGYLMKPMLVEEIQSPDGEVQKFYPKKVRRVISEETSNTIKAMLKNSVSNGIARGARVSGYSVMGKTGTSQTYRNGKALEGVGTTITSFAGFAPMDHPEFVVLVKFDFPKVSQWGSETAAGTFRRVATFLFQYFEVPPEY